MRVRSEAKRRGGKVVVLVAMSLTLIIGALLYDPKSVFSATGLDAGYGISITASGQSVLFQ